MDRFNYKPLHEVATEILRAREILRKQLEENTLDRPCLKPMRRSNGSVIGIIHVIPIIPKK